MHIQEYSLNTQIKCFLSLEILFSHLFFLYSSIKLFHKLDSVGLISANCISLLHLSPASGTTHICSGTGYNNRTLCIDTYLIV